MGKISKVLENICLDTTTKTTISELDKRMTALETYFEDHQAIEQKHSSLKQTPTKRIPPEPYNAEQGTGTPQPKVVMSRRSG